MNNDSRPAGGESEKPPRFLAGRALSDKLTNGESGLSGCSGGCNSSFSYCVHHSSPNPDRKPHGEIW